MTTHFTGGERPRLRAVDHQDPATASWDAEHAAERFRDMNGDTPRRRALELGDGDGFLWGLLRDGVVERGSVVTASPVQLDAALRTARTLGVEVEGQVGEPHDLPFPDAAFDVVVGNGVLSQARDVPAVLREVLRVLEPGGRFVLAGDPTTVGAASARGVRSVGRWLTAQAVRVPALTEFLRPGTEPEGSVDKGQSFRPEDLERWALRAGAVDVHAVTEDLAASWFSLPVIAVEAAVAGDRFGPSWESFTRRASQRLSWMDRTVLTPVLPRGVFHSVALTGTRTHGVERL